MRAGYFVEPQGLGLGQIVWVHIYATNANCGNTLLQPEVVIPPGAQLAPASSAAPQCFFHNTVSASSTFPCGGTTTTYRNGLLFGTANLPGTDAGTGTHSIEVRVPLVFSQNYSGPLTVSAHIGLTPRDASVDMSIPYQTMVMIPGVMMPPVQPTPSSTALGDDIMLVGSSLAVAGTLPVAFSNDDGSFTVTNYPVGDFAGWSRSPNVTRLAGDFDGDGNLDIALVGGTGWASVPVAMAHGDGSFHITNETVTHTDYGDFARWASSPNVKPVAGDFDADGDADIALVGGIGWNTVPIAFSNGDGSFRITNLGAGAFPTWAQAQGARPIVGDFNHDTLDDILLVGGDGWTMLPHAWSNGNGSFTAYNAGSYGSGWRPWIISGIRGDGGQIPLAYSWNFAQTVNEPGAQVLAADFNHDGMTDLVVTGTNTSQGPRFAIATGGGEFQLYEHHDTQWAGWASTAGAKLHVGDFNGDRYPDLALTGASGWNQLPLALNQWNGTFASTLRAIGNFGAFAALQGARVLVGDYNGDGFSDLAVTGASGLTQMPVAMNTHVTTAGGGGFNILQKTSGLFAAWTPDTTASLFVGTAN